MNRFIAAALAAFAATYAATAHGAICDGYTPVKENKLETCKGLWEEVGAPKYSDSAPDQLYVCHSRYVLSHNNERRTPDWVMEQLTLQQAKGDNTRPEGQRFVDETHICDKAKSHHDDYTGSKFDRGHMAPSADFASNDDLMVESFTMSNVVPQVGKTFNQGIWRELEAQVKTVAINRGKLYVVTGPIYLDEKYTITKQENPCGNEIEIDMPSRELICGSKSNCGSNGIAVPAALFKVVYDPVNKRANAFVMPNEKYTKAKKEKYADNIPSYRTSVAVVEKLTGLDLLPALPANVKKNQKNLCIPMMGH